MNIYEAGFKFLDFPAGRIKCPKWLNSGWSFRLNEYNELRLHDGFELTKVGLDVLDITEDEYYFEVQNENGEWEEEL